MRLYFAERGWEFGGGYCDQIDWEWDSVFDSQLILKDPRLSYRKTDRLSSSKPFSSLH